MAWGGRFMERSRFWLFGKVCVMSRTILITSGPTREPLDPVRFLSNGSSGRMGVALAEAAISEGFAVTVVSGPVRVAYPSAATVVEVETTREMLDAAMDVFERGDCVGVIGAAAPCDFCVANVSKQKIKKNPDGRPLILELVETPDILATLATVKREDQRIVGFALESESHTGAGLKNAQVKRQKKRCDLLVLNHPNAIGADVTTVSLIDACGEVVQELTTTKRVIAEQIVRRVFWDIE